MEVSDNKGTNNIPENRNPQNSGDDERTGAGRLLLNGQYLILCTYMFRFCCTALYQYMTNNKNNQVNKSDLHSHVNPQHESRNY